MWWHDILIYQWSYCRIYKQTQWHGQTWADSGATMKCLPWPIDGWIQLEFTSWTKLLIRTCTISLLFYYSYIFQLSIAIKCIVAYWTLWMHRTILADVPAAWLSQLHVTILARYFTCVLLIFIWCIVAILFASHFFL